MYVYTDINDNSFIDELVLSKWLQFSKQNIDSCNIIVTNATLKYFSLIFHTDIKKKELDCK